MDPNALVNPLLLWGSIGAIVVACFTAYKLIQPYYKNKKVIKNE